MTDGHSEQRDASKPAVPGHIVVKVHLRVRWWVRWYLRGVALMSRLTGLPPALSRVTSWTSVGSDSSWKRGGRQGGRGEYPAMVQSEGENCGF
jgi:hypothetical protein